MVLRSRPSFYLVFFVLRYYCISSREAVANYHDFGCMYFYYIIFIRNVYGSDEKFQFKHEFAFATLPIGIIFIIGILNLTVLIIGDFWSISVFILFHIFLHINIL